MSISLMKLFFENVNQGHWLCDLYYNIHIKRAFLDFLAIVITACYKLILMLMC